METVTWILQGLLAFVFLGAGMSKLAQPRQKLLENEKMAWTGDFSDGQVKGIGLLEVLAAIGLILPAALDVVPVITSIAATGLVLLMIGAARTHMRRNEPWALPINAVLGLIALAVAVLRFGPYSL